MSLISGALALFIIVLLSSKILARQAVRPSLSEAAIISVVFGAGVFHHATYDGSLSHIYSALEFSVLLVLYLPFRGSALSWGKATVAVVASALLILTRNLNIIALVWASLAAFYYSRWKILPTLRAIWPVVVGAVFGISAQLAYNFVATGRITLSSYGKEAFLWQRPMWDSVLLSYDKGLFTYYPIVLVTIAAGILGRGTRMLTILFVGCICTYAVVYGYWWCWYLGGFGHRGFVELMPFAILLLGYQLQNLSVWQRRTFLILSAAAALYTVQFMLHYWFGDGVFALVSTKIYYAQLEDWDRRSWTAAALFALLVLYNWKSPQRSGVTP